MNYIKAILKKEKVTVEELIECFEHVKRNGDVAVIKFDGERNESNYTIFISFPQHKRRDIIRADESTLKEGILKVLNIYVSL